MRIGVLECDHVDEKYIAIDGDYLDMFRRLLEPAAPGAELVGYDVVDGKLPASPLECDAWLITGSRYSVYDGHAWIAALSAFVREVHDAGTPLVGVCFGHQLLAHALGGRTERASSGWGVGAHRIEVPDAEEWMEPAAPTASLLFMHQDQVIEPPPGATVLARTEHCPVAMLQLGSSMLGMQAHPEFSAAYVDALLVARRERIGPERTDAARRSLDGTTDTELFAGWIARFLSAD
jgi:GMP synthase-like glutamine amidotransferase